MGVIFRHTVEALVSIAEKRHALSPDQLRALNVYPPRDVPVEVWSPAVLAISAALLPNATPGEQLENSGRVIVRSFAEGLVGRGLLMVVRMLGRKRALLRMSENFRSADSVMNVTAEDRGDTWVRLRFGAAHGLERHMLGIIDETLRMMAQPEPWTITGEAFGVGGYLLDVKW